MGHQARHLLFRGGVYTCDDGAVANEGRTPFHCTDSNTDLHGPSPTEHSACARVLRVGGRWGAPRDGDAGVKEAPGGPPELALWLVGVPSIARAASQTHPQALFRAVVTSRALIRSEEATLCRSLSPDPAVPAALRPAASEALATSCRPVSRGGPTRTISDPERREGAVL